MRVQSIYLPDLMRVKIPLTDAELIKALLLQADLYPASEERYVRQRLFEIASEWDDIEAKLQDEKNVAISQ
ncbi:MAG: hypothetical protein H6613_00030 [Ignavibacteriales bacterium]|nr:hypothetical protein [Ignavibacteriales bacterium]